MTEIERIISSGIIEESFLDEEIKNDFLITTERKKLFAIILDLLLKFDYVCKKHSLRYFLHAGSLLGAVRHKGFIPWDDDLDVVMPREDYDRFIKLGNEFSEPYFLQTPYTDAGYFYSFAKLRNSNTSGITQMFKYAGYNMGIWISMFPLDYWSLSGGEERYYRIKQLVMYNSTYMRMSNPDLDEKNKMRVESYIHEHRDPMRDYMEIERLATMFNESKSDYVTTAVITQNDYKDKIWDASDYAEPIPIQFENFIFPAPCGYKRLLTKWYGDYMQLPPVEARGLWHNGTIFDADTPYKDYLKKQGII